MTNEELYEKLANQIGGKCDSMCSKLDDINEMLEDAIRTSDRIIVKLDSIISTSDRIICGLGSSGPSLG